MTIDTKFDISSTVYYTHQVLPKIRCGLCDGNAYVSIVGKEGNHLCPRCGGSRQEVDNEEWRVSQPCTVIAIWFKSSLTSGGVQDRNLPSSTLAFDLKAKTGEVYKLDSSRVFGNVAAAQEQCDRMNVLLRKKNEAAG